MTAAEPATAYPLTWPLGRPRTPAKARMKAPFHRRATFQGTYGVQRDKRPLTLSDARDELIEELGRLGAAAVVISTNVELRRDGIPRGDRRAPDDPGVAVYFTRKARQVCFCCDRWTTVEANLKAIAKTIEAIRGIDRWGTGDMVDAAFTGFQALPAPKNWRQVLGDKKSVEEVEEAYKQLAYKRHPDRGGSNESMAELNDAVARAMRELKGS